MTTINTAAQSEFDVALNAPVDAAELTQEELTANAFNCFGTAGTFGSATGTAGTAGTFGCLGGSEEIR